MSSPTSNYNPRTTTLNADVKRENLNYISKLGLSANVAHHIDLREIFYDVHIDDLSIALDIELNLWVLNCLESNQLSPSLVVDLILEVFYEEFHGQEYTKFSKLDQNIKQVLKETLMAKRLYVKWSTYDKKHQVAPAGGGCSA